MRRLCERPGCGAPAEVSYGIDNATLTVWVDNRAVLEREQAGRLCRRHADALAMPRGWTLDDRRQPIPQLFRVLDGDVPVKRAPRKSVPGKKPVKREKSDGGPSLFEELEAELAARETAHVSSSRADNVVTERDDSKNLVGADDPPEPIDPDETKALPWSPHFVSSPGDDENDDTDQPVFGRLLGRAFGKKDS